MVTRGIGQSAPILKNSLIAHFKCLILIYVAIKRHILIERKMRRQLSTSNKSSVTYQQRDKERQIQDIISSDTIRAKTKKDNQSSLFDVRRFDKILDMIFPSSDPAVIEEVHEEKLSAPDFSTPEELLTENTAPGYVYITFCYCRLSFLGFVVW